MKKIFWVLLCVSYIQRMQAREEKDVPHIFEGNLALAPAQTPAPLFCFGQTIIGQGVVQTTGTVNINQGRHKKYIEVVPSILYGVSNTITLQLALPVTASLRSNCCHSSGMEDMSLQAEYAFFNSDHPTYAIQATVLGALFMPTGSFKKNPPTGAGDPGIFLGSTLSYEAIDWYAFLSLGGLLPTNHQHGRLNNQLFYQAGIGRNIAYVSKKWLFTALLEFYGTYSKEALPGLPAVARAMHKARGGAQGTVCWLGPSLWFATSQLVVQVGVIAPVVQTHNKAQKDNYFASVCLRWNFD